MSKTAAIKLYTNHACPWSHRAHITLAELGLAYEEEIIDLNTPRSPEYLKINPRGSLPSLVHNGDIITDSAIVAQFLADTYPSHLVPASSDPKGPLARARIAFFVDAWLSKVNGFYMKTLNAKTAADAEENADLLVKGIEKEIEPLLNGAAPFFGGSDKITLAEILTGSFVIRLKTFGKHGLLPASLQTNLKEKTPNFQKWSDAIVASPSVYGVFNEEFMVSTTKARQEKARAA